MAARRALHGLICIAALAYVACDSDTRANSPLAPVGPHMEESADSDSTDADKYAPDPEPEALYPPTPGDSGAANAAPSAGGGLSSLSVSGPLLSAAGGSDFVFDETLGRNLGYADDQCTMQPIGFPFEFFGRSYTSAGISANGQLIMNGLDLVNGLPICRNPSRFDGTLGLGRRGERLTEVEIAPAFGDWVLQSLRRGDPTSNVYFKTVGTAPDRRFVVTWNKASAFPNYVLPVFSTFQVQLFEGSNKILFGYNGLFIAPANVVTGLSSGTGTIIKSAAGLGFFTLDHTNLCYVPSGDTYVPAPASECGNHPPTANAGGNNATNDAYLGAEGAAVTFTGTGTDVDDDALSYAWDFDGDGRTDATTATAQFTYADNGSYVARLTVTDVHRASTSATVPVTISNVAPAVSAGDDVTVPGGTAAVVDATFTDPGANDHDWTFSINWGDGSGDATGSVSTADAHVQGTHVYATSGVYTVTVTVTDKDGGAGTSSFRATVLNRPPTAHAGGNNAAGDAYLGVEGVDVEFNGSGSDPDGDPLEYSWSFGDGTGAASGSSTRHSYGDNGTYTATLTVTDSHGASASAQVQVTIANVAPTATFGQSATTVKEGSEFSLTLTEPRDVAADLPGLTYAFDCGGGYGDYGQSPSVTCETVDNGTLTVRAKIRDKDGGESEYSESVEVINVPPTGQFTFTTPVDEGTSITLSIADAFDPSSADRAAGFTYAFDCGDGKGYGPYAAEAAASCPTTDNGVRAVGGKIRDKDGGESEYTGSATVNNVSPALGPITMPTDPMPVGSTVRVSAPFADPGSADTHAGSVQWDIGQAFVAADPIDAGARAVTATSSSLGAGVYTISLRVRDDDGGEDTKTGTGYVVVYDPSGGFVTGGGWIWSPTGACRLAASCEALEGHANLGFVAKYLPGTNTPSGNTEFQFHAGRFEFSSTSYQWLVVAGARAQFKGEGTVNGQGRYRFLLTAIDGQVSGGGGTDRFRIKVWAIDADGTDGRVVYDNQMGADEDSDASTALGGGSIVIHKEKE